MNTIAQQLSQIDFSILSQNDKSELAAILLQKVPDITGLIHKAAKDQELQTTHKFQEIKQEVTNGTCTVDKIESFIQDISKQYTFLLSQVGVVENQLTQAESMRLKLADQVIGLRIATLPIALMMDLVKTLKECRWAKIIWDEKNGTKSNHITEYARLVDIFVEPNMQWTDTVTFKMLMGGYLPEAEYESLRSKMNLRLAAYNIATGE